MAVLDVSVIKAFNVRESFPKKGLKIYLRLQQQHVCSTEAVVNGGEVHFRDKFRFHYDPNHYTRDNRLFIELWRQSFFSNSCLSVAWVQLNTLNFVHREPITLSLCGRFEDSCATFVVVIVPTNFGSVVQPPLQHGQPVLGIPLSTHNPPAATCAAHDLTVVPPPQYSPPYHKSL